MPAFAVLRHSRSLARMVLAAFLLTLTCAIAAPVINPQSTTMVCTASGDVKLVAAGNAQGNEAPAVTHHALDCVLCLALSAPPSAPTVWLPAHPLVAGIVCAEPTDPALAHRATPPPARGPPALS